MAPACTTSLALRGINGIIAESCAHHGRPDQLRPLTFRRRYTRQAAGSVLVQMGRTTVLCTCCVEQAVPPFLVGHRQGLAHRRVRHAARHAIDAKRDAAARSMAEASRFSGSSAAVFGPWSSWASWGNGRSGSIATCWRPTAARARPASTAPTWPWSMPSGRSPICRGRRRFCAAASRQSASACSTTTSCSTWITEEDKDAEVDLNLVMTGAGQFIEVQGTGEEATFSRGQLDRLLKLGKAGHRRHYHCCKSNRLGANWPLD